MTAPQILRRAAAVLGTSVLALGLASCNQRSEDTAPAVATPAPAETAAPAATTTPAGETQAEARAQGHREGMQMEREAHAQGMAMEKDAQGSAANPASPPMKHDSMPMAPADKAYPPMKDHM